MHINRFMVYDLTNIFHRAPDQTKAKALIMMGGIYPTKSYFDMQTQEDSFADILTDRGIEWWTFDSIGTGISDAKLPFGDHHDTNLKIARQLVLDNNIEYIMGYSYSVLLAARLITENKHTIKKAFFWDPWANANPSKEYLDDDYQIFDKLDYMKSMIRLGVTVTPRILQDHIDNMFLTEGSKKQIFPSYSHHASTRAMQELSYGPSQVNDLGKILPIKIAFSKNSWPKVRESFREEDRLFYEDCSHWIWLEPGRYRLADDFCEFILDE